MLFNTDQCLLTNTEYSKHLDDHERDLDGSVGRGPAVSP